MSVRVGAWRAGRRAAPNRSTPVNGTTGWRRCSHRAGGTPVAVWRRPWMSLAVDTYGVDCSICSVSERLRRFARAVSGGDTRGGPERAPNVVLLPSEPYEFGASTCARSAAVPGVPIELIDGRDSFWWGTARPRRPTAPAVATLRNRARRARESQACAAGERIGRRVSTCERQLVRVLIGTTCMCVRHFFADHHHADPARVHRRCACRPIARHGTRGGEIGAEVDPVVDSCAERRACARASSARSTGMPRRGRPSRRTCPDLAGDDADEDGRHRPPVRSRVLHRRRRTGKASRKSGRRT